MHRRGVFGCWQDRDGWGNDGCEASVPVVCNLYVAAGANAAQADGSAAKPFADPQLAVKAAQPE